MAVAGDADPAAMAVAGDADPAAMAVAGDADKAPHGEQTSNAGRLWISLALATALLILLIIFIAENSRSVTISFLGASGHISLGLALLIAAVVGVAVALLAGTARILQLRSEVRRHVRAGATHGHGPQPH
jgi:uncharacterized integral membrane protein